jgi:hypothetical protein
MSVHFVSPGNCVNNQKFRKAGGGTTAKPQVALVGTDREAMPRAYMIGNCMRVGEQRTGVTGGREYTIPVGHEPADVS